MRPAAASVDAPPIRYECVDMRVKSMPRYDAMFFSWRDSCGAFSTQSIFGLYCKEWAVGFGARALSMCPHLGHVTVFVCVVCALKLERVSASLLVILSCFDVDMNGCRVCVSAGGRAVRELRSRRAVRIVRVRF